MAEGQQQNGSFDQSDERFKYIGFEVYPGKAGDIFKSDDERQTWVQRVRAKLTRSESEVRDGCTLMESRLSSLEKWFLTVASVLMIVALFIPWYSGYVPIPYEEIGIHGDQAFVYTTTQDNRVMRELTAILQRKHDRAYASDQMVGKAAPGDSATAAGQDAGTAEGSRLEGEARVPRELKVIFVNTVSRDSLKGLEDVRKHLVAYLTYDAVTKRADLRVGGEALALIPDVVSLARSHDSAETAARYFGGTRSAGDTAAVQAPYRKPSVVTDDPVEVYAARGVINDPYSVTGIGALAGIGTFGSKVFSSGFALMLSGLLMILFFLAAPVLAVLNLYVLHKVKMSSPDDYVLYVKRMLRYNWVPIFLWLAMLLLSIMGADYGFNTSGMLKQIGQSYGLATFIGLSSFGIYLTLASFLIVALKGKEI
jgi:hypothetical protein